MYDRVMLSMFFVRLYAGWMRFAHVLGTINAHILLTVFFGVILLPFGLVMRVVRYCKPEKRGWIRREHKVMDIASLRRLF